MTWKKFSEAMILSTLHGTLAFGALEARSIPWPPFVIDVVNLNLPLRYICEFHPLPTKSQSGVPTIKRHNVFHNEGLSKESGVYMVSQWTLSVSSRLLCISTATLVTCFCIRRSTIVQNYIEPSHAVILIPRAKDHSLVSLRDSKLHCSILFPPSPSVPSLNHSITHPLRFTPLSYPHPSIFTSLSFSPPNPSTPSSIPKLQRQNNPNLALRFSIISIVLLLTTLILVSLSS
jgi:hypothetical protein